MKRAWQYRRRGTENPVGRQKLVYQRCLRLEPLEDRRLLTGSGHPELLGMTQFDPAVDPFSDQIIYLDFDGAEDVTYNGPISIEGLTIPAFDAAPFGLAGQENAIIDLVLEELNSQFAGTRAAFTGEVPTSGRPYSTIFVGGDDSAFREYGSFRGLAEGDDLGNVDRTDHALVFSEVIAENLPNATVESSTFALTDVISHETRHLTGDVGLIAQHTGPGPLDDVAMVNIEDEPIVEFIWPTLVRLF